MCTGSTAALQHRPENRNRFSESTMRRFKVLERPLCVRKDARRSRRDARRMLTPVAVRGVPRQPAAGNSMTDKHLALAFICAENRDAREAATKLAALYGQSRI